MVIVLLTTIAGASAVGCMSKSVVFVTSTKFGLDASQRQDQKVELTFGYERSEVASVPMCDDREGEQPSPNGPSPCAPERGLDARDNWDAYSLLGAFHVDYGNPFSAEPLVVRQVMASGFAARELAADPSLRSGFMDAAKDAVESAPANP